MIKSIFNFEKKEKVENKGTVFLNKESKNHFSKSKEILAQYPQVINNYDVNVRVNIKKLNDNKINIENMNISESINRKIDKNEKKDYFNKTDNNIDFLNFNKYNFIDNNISQLTKPINENEQNIQHYNNMINNLKNEFKEITKRREININNVLKKERKPENLKVHLLNENNNIHKIIKIKELNINNRNSIINNKQNIINNKKYSWNLKSLDNKKNKIEEIYAENNEDHFIKEKEELKENKMKTQNNFYKIPNKYAKELAKEKKEEKIKTKDKKKNKNLKKAINFINNNKKLNYLNLTDNNLKINNLNDESNIIGINEKYNPYLHLTFNNNTNNINKNNNNILKEYISASNNQNKNSKIKSCNNSISNKNISPFNDKNQNFILDEKKEKINYNKYLKFRNNNSYIKNQNYTTNNINEHLKLLYLDKRINKIRTKMINQMKKENIMICSNKEINNIKISKNISFSFIQKINIKQNELSKKELIIINRIFNIQNNIIFELKQKEFILKNELIKKNKEIKELKNICLKLMWFIKNDNIYTETNKKKYMIQNQIIKENLFLRKLCLNNRVNSEIINRMSIIDNKMKIIRGVNEDGLFHNAIHKLKEKSNYNYEYGKKEERLVTLENNGRFNRERYYFNDKKRNKSYERINEKNKKYGDKNKISNKDMDIINNNLNHYYCTDYIIKKNINLFGNNNDNNIKIGKKIKYITK